MRRIENFASKHTLIYCILAEIIVLFGMMLFGTVVSIAFTLAGVEADSYVLLAVQEASGVLLALAAMKLCGCADILGRRGDGIGRGLLTGGYFLVISVYSGVFYLLSYEGARVLRPWYLIAAFVICMLFVGLAEEFLFRGVLAELLRRHFGVTSAGVWKAVVISGVLFGAAHLTNLLGAEPLGVFVQTISAGVMGMAFAAIYFRSGCIWVTVAIHALLDLCGLITSGLYAGSVSEVVSGYTPLQLVGVIPYVVVLLVVLRKKKMNQIIARLESADEAMGRKAAEEAFAGF